MRRAFPFFVALLTGLAIGGPAAAQKVLILHTAENDRGAINVMNNAVAEFRTGTSSATEESTLGKDGAITATTFAPGYDLVVMVSTYKAIPASNWAAIQAAMQARSATAFALFIDGCSTCSRSTNVDQMGKVLQAAKPDIGTLGADSETRLSLPLNKTSPYSPSFAGLDPLLGGYVTLFNGVPTPNALYLNQGAAQPSATTASLDNVYGLIVPASQSFNGAGACLFATVDSTLFMNTAGEIQYDTNRGKIAPAFIAATKAGGSCLPPQLGIAKSAPVPGLQIGAGSTYTLTVTNHGAFASPGATVQDVLPTGLTFVSAGGTGWTCTGTATLACTYAAAIAPGQAAAALEVRVTTSAQVTAGTALTNYASVDPIGGAAPPAAGATCAPASACAQSTATVAPPPPPPPAAVTPVPTLSEWALALLAALLGALAGRRRGAVSRG